MFSRIVVLTIFMLILAVTSTTAQSPVSFWVGGSLGYNSYSLSDLNDEITAVGNAAGIPGKKITGDLGYQFEAGLALKDGLSFGLGYERLSGNSAISDYSGGIEYQAPANAYFGMIEYAFPTHSTVGVSLGASFGQISSAGALRLWATGEGSVSAPLSGKGFYGEGRLIGNIRAGKVVSFAPSIGYRMANIREIKLMHEKIYNADGSNYQLDYSGITAHVGVKLSFGG